MSKKIIILPLLGGVIMSAMIPAHAISEAYRRQLEQSGCTQLSEANGCDIHQSKAQNHRVAEKPSSVLVSVKQHITGRELASAVSWLTHHGWRQSDEDPLTFWNAAKKTGIGLTVNKERNTVSDVKTK